LFYFATKNLAISTSSIEYSYNILTLAAMLNFQLKKPQQNSKNCVINEGREVMTMPSVLGTFVTGDESNKKENNISRVLLGLFQLEIQHCC
jgi:hypothetical protein